MYPVKQENARFLLLEEMVPMRDGVCLYTRTAVPKGAGKVPTVFIRTPYEESHNGVPHSLESYDGDGFLTHGYAVVVQHCCGRYDSEGYCIPYTTEKEDGLDCLEYIRKQPFYNGEIYVTGGSYTAFVHLAYLTTDPEDVKGAMLSIMTDRLYLSRYRNGCSCALSNLAWWMDMMKRQYPNPQWEDPVKRPYKDLMKRLIGEDVPAFTDMLLNTGPDDPFWHNMEGYAALDHIRVPVLLVEGWYDWYVEGMFSMWSHLPEETRNQSAFLVEPWGHAFSVVPEAEYPIVKGNFNMDYTLEWFDSIRNGVFHPVIERNKVTYHSMGENVWRKECYPVPSAQARRLYFAQDGKLGLEADIGSLCYRYDPEHLLDPHVFRYNSIFKADAPNTIDGVLSFVSTPFEEDARFLGEITWHMWVESNCEDTSFYMRVYFVEDGIAYNVTDTIVALSHEVEDYHPHEKALIDVKTPPIAFAIKKGGSVRVDISSTSSRYAPHANVKGSWAEVTETKVAHNTVHFEDSFIELPQENSSVIVEMGTTILPD